MHDYHIAVIPGDGIGQEITRKACASWTRSVRRQARSNALRLFPMGVRVLSKDRQDDGGRRIEDAAAIRCHLFWRRWLSLSGARSHFAARVAPAICQGFDQYVCLRPSLLLPGIKSPLAGKKPGDIDFVVVRENTEGEYTGAGGRAHRGLPIELAIETSVSRALASSA